MMATTNEKILDAFQKAAHLNTALWREGIDSATVSITELQELVEKEFGLKFELFTVDIEADHLYGLIERYAGEAHARIYISKNISVRWKRLVAAKEFCHAIVDSSEDFTTDGIDTLQRLIAGRLLDQDAPENVGVRSEHLAEIVAYELLYPHELRRSDLERISSGATTLERVAAKYRLPEVIILRILSVPYLELCDTRWAQVFDLHQKAGARKASGL